MADKNDKRISVREKKIVIKVPSLLTIHRENIMHELDEEFEMEDPLLKLSKDLTEASGLITSEEARYLVDLYYQIQDFRIQAQGEIRAMSGEKYMVIDKKTGKKKYVIKIKEPTNLVEWVFMNLRRVEGTIKASLNRYTDNEPTGMGAWAKAICGIGPVLSAGFLAHIEMDPWICANRHKLKVACRPQHPCAGELCKRIPLRAVGSVWRFSGQDPTSVWEKGKKRPWNARLKVLCWKTGESFVKNQNRKNDVYGKLFVQKKAEEQAKNEAGEFAEQAKAVLLRKKIGKDTEAYKAYSVGKLPPAHIHARARRWTIKIFLYHWFAEAYRRRWNKEAPMPYVIEHLGHTHLI